LGTYLSIPLGKVFLHLLPRGVGLLHLRPSVELVLRQRNNKSTGADETTPLHRADFDILTSQGRDLGWNVYDH
jgi:hypothetical protein